MKPIELGRMRVHKVHEMDSPVPLLGQLPGTTRADMERLLTWYDQPDEVNADPDVRDRWAGVVRERRAVLRGWVEGAVRDDELQPVPANALAAIVLALADGLMLHAALDPLGFRWANVSKAVDAILDGIRGTA